jgi:hypothetical protein
VAHAVKDGCGHLKCTFKLAIISDGQLAIKDCQENLLWLVKHGRARWLEGRCNARDHGHTTPRQIANSTELHFPCNLPFHDRLSFISLQLCKNYQGDQYRQARVKWPNLTVTWLVFVSLGDGKKYDLSTRYMHAKGKN